MQSPAVTFVCCVESGYLESQTVRLVQSLRRYGGRFADAPIVAVTPRIGPPLGKATRSVFKAIGVKHIRTKGIREYSWFNFLNKPLALAAAEEWVDTEIVGFLDSDLLVVREPEQLGLGGEDDFAAFPVECKEMGTTGAGDPYETLWRESCRIANISIDELPWITTAQTAERVRLYFNGGLFVYRRATGFGREYLRLCRALLDARVTTAAKGYGEGYKEMVSIGFAVVTLGLKWRPLDYAYNYPMSSLIHRQWYSAARLRDARIVHYHDAMWPPFWETFLSCMQDTHPEVSRWLASLGPMKNEAPLTCRVLSRWLRATRVRQSRRYQRSCWTA